MPRVKALVPDRTLDRRGKWSRSGDRGLDWVPNAGKPSKVEAPVPRLSVCPHGKGSMVTRSRSGQSPKRRKPPHKVHTRFNGHLA